MPDKAASAGVGTATLQLEAAALAYCRTQPGHALVRTQRDGHEVACPPCLQRTLRDDLPPQPQAPLVEVHPDLTGPNLEVLLVLANAVEELTAEQIAARTTPPLSGTATAGARIRDLRAAPYNYPILAERRGRDYVYWLDDDELTRRRAAAAHPAGSAVE
jgi:hypothetical protein